MTREQAPIAHPVQPAPEPVAWHGGGNLYWIPENAPRGLTLNPLYDGPWVQPAGDALPLVWHEAPTKTQWGHGMMSADIELSRDETLRLYAHRDALHLVSAALASQVAEKPASEPAGDVAWLPDWIQSLRADTGHFVSAEAAADLAEQVRRKFAEAQPVCELTRLRGVLLEIVREDAEGRGYFAAIALKALRADTQPAGDALPPIAAAQKPDSARVGRSPVVPGDLITSDAAASEPAGDVRPAPEPKFQPLCYCNACMGLLVHPAGGFATAVQRPAGEDRAAERYHRLSAFADWDNEGGKGYWRIQFRSELSESLDDAIDALAETQRPAPKPDKPALSDGGTK